MTPEWKKLKDDFGFEGRIKYKMGGLLPSWRHFEDNVNSIRRPAQMGPEWMHAQKVTGVEINERIWVTDPPASSYPACIAVKCAALQAADLEIPFFETLQRAVMADNLNIARKNVLLELALGFSRLHPAFDPGRFESDLLDEEGASAFRKDLQECKYLNIHRLPTIVFRFPGRTALSLEGFQGYDTLRKYVTSVPTSL